MTHPRPIGLVIHKATDKTIQTLSDVLQYLLEKKHHGLVLDLWLNPLAQAHAKVQDLPSLPLKPLAKKCDILIVIGGDGSMLATAPTAAAYHTPLIGLNCGKLGFLTDVHPHHLDELKTLLTGLYEEEKRMLLHLKDTETYAFNDIVLVRSGPANHMLKFDVHIDGDFVCHQEADGMVIATPTGSTAYALSAGGTILHPALPAIALVPLCPHRLNSRPIVVPSHSQITLTLTSDPSRASLNADGQPVMACPETFTIELAAKEVRLHHPKPYCYYDTLRRKLHWESKKDT